MELTSYTKIFQGETMTQTQKDKLIGEVVKVNCNGKLIEGIVKGRLLKFPVVMTDFGQFQVAWKTLQYCIENNIPVGR